ncbi:unnamed protein product [Linum tenue]|uniref:Uncharacterized protein n=1 Tax=Linum tenue TaxID=586396 RepID=A0AAV0KTG4_9ROSI|nr:unnamed protein product [Linum tenue]
MRRISALLKTTYEYSFEKHKGKPIRGRNEKYFLTPQRFIRFKKLR